ncbi:SH3 domain and tetratricopeptide repeat-containing protein 1 isoform X2 [Bombina bombina]|uniref:SH3 domain and tetratricopeptide repeat-containing protein 1 isoform X2 n=1 Tax=Bombina bombina TaxID=8345 RepID=UPI00235A9C11|nr:SH3 domain and tetratricopeptide repeat-containing protein 1 isoform X2 [Bombina bombina]
MDQLDINTNNSQAVFYKLHTIQEDELESEVKKETDLEKQELSTGIINKRHGAKWGDPISEEGQVKNSKSLVASMKKVISSLGPSAPDVVADFVHINDCLKTDSGQCSDQTDTFITDLCLQIVMVRNGVPDPHLQGEVRKRLRLLENDNKEVAAVLSELSARLLSIQSDKDLIIVTFKTFEEIWKFSTYFSLGFLNHCMENIFLDESYWLSSPEEDDTEIQVHFSEESLHLIYKGLLVEEGLFFVLCPDNHIRQATVVDEVLQVSQDSPIAEVQTVGWYPTKHSETGASSLNAKDSPVPLCPFHQWFLKTNSVPDLDDVEFMKKNIIATDKCEALVNYESTAPDEISYRSGDIIEIVSTFMQCMTWFVGKNVSSGDIGFVKTSNVKALASENGQTQITFIFDQEKVYPGSKDGFNLKNAEDLLQKISHSDVCTIYRIDEFEEMKCSQNRETQTPTPNTEAAILKERIKDFIIKCNKSQALSETTEKIQNNSSSCLANEMQMNCEDYEDPTFCIFEEKEKDEALQSLLLFLNSEKFLPSFRNLYDMSYSFLKISFNGYNEEEELVRYLSMAREAAKKANMIWALTRLCFLLGRLSTKRNKFSQARVYFEEALGVINGDFGDLYLISALYANVTAIYLKQKYKERYLHVIDKAASLLMGIQNNISSTEMESVILKYALKKTIFSQDQYTEARASLLLAKLYTNLRQYDEALPFIERLQVLMNILSLNNSSSSSSGLYFKLAEIYSHKCLPHMALSCVKVISCGSCSFLDSLKRVDFIIENSPKFCEIKRGRLIFPTQIAYYLKKALTLAHTEEEQALCTLIYLSLSELCTNNKQYKKAKLYLLKVIDSSISMDVKIRDYISVSLAWLYMLEGENNVALDILDSVMKLCSCTSHQLGYIHNICAISLRRTNNIKDAAVHYCKALHISKETGNLQNHAAALANFGTLCLHLKAPILAEHFLVRSVSIYSRLPTKDTGIDFIHVLIMLGRFYISGIYKEQGRFYFEWAFLVAMETNHLEGQLQSIQLLCYFYSKVVVNEAQCIIYNEYQLSLARKMSDKVLEGQILETISQLYLSLGTERACRSALDYTKRSLGIFIDLQKKEKEAYAWLCAGKIYYILGQNELVDLYIQVAQNVALNTGDPSLGMELFEAAGDIFLNGTSDRDKAISFYRERALPLAVKTENLSVELRLSNKLTELLMNKKSYEESLEHAKTALALSVIC